MTWPPDQPAPGVDPALAFVVEQAVADLAERLHVPAADIAVVSSELVSWPDAGLGCRAEGMRYKQVPTDGSRTVLQHGGRRFAYHTGGRRSAPFLCEHPA